MERFLYMVVPQLLLLLFGTLLGIWGILLRRSDLGLERYAVILGRVGAACYLVWLWR